MNRRLLCSIVILLLSIINICPSVNAANENPTDAKTHILIAAERQLKVEKTRHALLRNKLKALQHDEQKIPVQTIIDANLLRRAELTIALAQADVESIALTLNAAQQAVDLTQNNINVLEGQAKDLTTLFHASKQQQEQLQQQIKNQRLLLALQQDRVKVLQQTQTLASRALVIGQEWRAQLQAKYQIQQRQMRQQALDKLAASLQAEQQKWLSRINELNQQLQELSNSGVSNSSAYSRIEMGIFEAEERSNSSQIQLDLARLRARYDDLTSNLPSPPLPVSTLNTMQRQLDILSGQVKEIAAVLKDKIDLLQKRIKILMQGEQSGALVDDEIGNNLNSLYRLQANYKRHLDEATALQTKVNAQQEQLTKELNNQLARRQNLPGFSSQEWVVLGEKMLQIPALTWQTINGLQKSVVTAVKNAHYWQWVLWLLAICAWVFLGIKLQKYLKPKIKKMDRRKRDSLTTSTFSMGIKLLQRHLLGIMSLAGFIGLLLLMGLCLSLFGLVIEIAVVILGFRILISLARLSLLENITDEAGKDVRLYRRLKWVLRIGALLTILTVLVAQLPLPYDLQNIFGRLFMVFLLVVSLVLLRGWEVVPTLLQPYLEHKQVYLRQVVRILSLLIPLSILSNSIIGLLGYVELAWKIAVYQGIFLLVITGYLIARGVLGEIMKFFSEQVIRWSRHGWLWSEALLKPLHQVLKIILLIEAIIILFKAYGWGTHSLVVRKIADFFSYHLFALGGSVITPLNIIIFLAVIAVLVWAARWSREFAYRWLFAGTKDLGLRNSLSIFTQYTIVLIGILIALRIAGINVTALTVVASAFAFGIGLGLRDLANNFVSGLLLLIERPVRVGDFVTIGNLDGQVMHIGMRSITVTTDDHKELLVPNADVFSKLFMNWTHRDSIVRTLFFLHVNRTDDPHHVRELILEVMRSIPEVLSNPPPEVYFKKMQDMLLEFEIEYFLDVRKVFSRVSVHSNVLFKLWDRFALEGIHPPHYPHEILLQSPSDFVSSRSE